MSPLKTFIRPREGLLVRLPDGPGHLPAGGKAVVWSPYWERRRKDGDVIIGPAQAAPPAGEPTDTRRKGSK